MRKQQVVVDEASRFQERVNQLIEKGWTVEPRSLWMTAISTPDGAYVCCCALMEQEQ